MLSDVIGIYRARRDPKAAARLAAKLAQDQAFERAKAPLLVPLIIIWAVIVLCAVLVTLSLWGYVSLHGSVGLLGIIPAAVGFGLFKLQKGLRAGVSKIEAIADSYAQRGLDKVMPMDANALAENSDS